MSCCSNLRERCSNSNSSWGSALADMEPSPPGMDMAGMEDKAETVDRGETAEREDRAGKGDTEALRPCHNSNSSSSNGAHNARRGRGRGRGNDDDA
jgi:hypothetical protein